MKHASKCGQHLKSETTPIEEFLMNHYYEHFDRWFSRYRAFTQRFIGPCGGRQHVKLHTAVLGRYLCKFDGSEYRFRVWEDREKGWRVFVNPYKGICFETFKGFDPLVAWADYTNRFVSYFLVQELMRA